MNMVDSLDITPLRSLVAVADQGGFLRAASSLHLSQGAVSQHVRRLESAIGRRLVERHGRGSRFTQDGEQLVAQARRILAAHDDTLRSFGVQREETLTIGSTEHAAAQLLPAVAAALTGSAHGDGVRFRIDRGARLLEGLTKRSVDLALLLEPDAPGSTLVGDLEVAWFASPGWDLPIAPSPVPVVAFDGPCPLRTRALETLAAHQIPAAVGVEASQLAGVQAAAAAGLGVALMAALGPAPEGLVRVPGLPRPEALQLHLCSRPGLPGPIMELVADAVRPLLAAHTPAADGA